MKKCLPFLLLLMCAWQVHAQELNFSQFYEQPLLRNPALAGIFNEDVRITGIYRNQWQSITVPYQTEGVSAEYKIPNSLWTVGGQITNDMAGDIQLRRSQILLNSTLRWKWKTDDDLVWQAGIIAGYGDSRFDPTKATFDDQFVNGSFDPSNPTGQVFNIVNRSYFELNAGIAINGSFTGNPDDGNYYIGLAGFHLASPPAPSPTFMNKKWAINTGIVYPVTDMHNLLLFADFFVQGGNKQFLAGGLGEIYRSDDYEKEKKFSVYVGGIYRLNDAVAPCFKIDYFGWGAGLSYDINISKLAGASQSRGGFEFTFTYKNFISTDAEVKCPPHFKF